MPREVLRRLVQSIWTYFHDGDEKGTKVGSSSWRCCLKSEVVIGKRKSASYL